ncbi:hypothetical protein GCM10025858_00870 [Alicyclobacillus sacchari]|nr:hypothetical protein GCM10025858_00870 [Alicyclobacillus sacchari]
MCARGGWRRTDRRSAIALFTAQQGLNEPRYPSLPGIMKAKKKPLTNVTLADLGLSPDDVAPRVARTDLSLPPKRQAGQRLSGDVEAQAEQLADIILQATSRRSLNHRQEENSHGKNSACHRRAKGSKATPGIT